MSSPISLRLWFSGGSRPELLKTHFRHRLTDRDSVCVRGKTTGGAKAARGTFQWTAAVQALSLLIVRTAAEHAISGSTAGLEGEAGSPAASLDWALGKPPGWLIEMFGVQSTGEPVIRRCMLRTNPDRRRSGPTTVALNGAFLPASTIQVYLDDKLVTNPLELRALASGIEQQVQPAVHTSTESLRPASPLPAPFDRPDVQGHYRALIQNEILTGLFSTNIFTAKGVDQALARIARNPTFEKLTSGRADLIHPIDRTLSRSERYGAGHTSLAKEFPEKPLTIATQAGQMLSIALFTFLKGVRGYPFNIDYRFHHAIEVMRMIIEKRFAQPPDLCVLGIAPAATLLSHGPRTGYRPLMLLGGHTHRMLGPKGAAGIQGAEFHFLRDDPSTSMFYFESLSQANEVDPTSINIRHAETDEMLALLESKQADARAIAFFPYYHLYQLFGEAVLVDQRDDEKQLKEFILFAHESVLAKPRLVQAIDVAVRDAWLTLKENSAALEHVLDVIMHYGELFKWLKRFAGVG